MLRASVVHHENFFSRRGEYRSFLPFLFFRVPVLSSIRAAVQLMLPQIWQHL